MRIAQLAWEKKAENIKVLDVSDLAQFTDYFVLLTAEVELHSRAIADFIEQSLKAEGIRPHHIEGRMNLQWVLLDYIDVVVHVFLPQIREFYDLEAYWGEAKTVKTDFDARNDSSASASTSPPLKTTRPFSRNELN